MTCKMHLRDLANQTDPADFQRLYHDPRIHTSEIATRFGILPNRVSEFAHLLGVKTRRQAGVMWTPTLLRPKRARGERRLGQGGCNPDCPEWRRCTSASQSPLGKGGRLWVSGPLPCETLLPFEIGVEYDVDSSPSLWVIPIQVRVNVEALG